MESESTFHATVRSSGPEGPLTVRPLVVVVGAGPSGFYAADQLLEAGFAVDVIDILPTPFGLVRSGVAPDHLKIKAVTRVYERTARKDGFRFFGGVGLGEHVTRADLLERYHAIVYAFGTADDQRMGIPGEDRPGSHAAQRFVAWYNGHPDASYDEYDLSARRAVVIGNGNVALDIARMLVLHPEELHVTDAADHAIEAFSRSHVTEVVVLGRRGPAQVAFSNPELHELNSLRRAGVEVCTTDLELDEHSARWLDEEAGVAARKNVDLLRDYACRPARDTSHRVILRFLRSPLEILGDGEDGPVTGVRVAINEIQPTPDGGLRAVSTGREEIIDAGLVLRSIGFRGRPVDEVPFDERVGLVRNIGGRVCNEAGDAHRGEYVVGWIKRGPSGVIGTNKKDATDTVARILEDRDVEELNTPALCDANAIARFYAERAPDCVTWAGWAVIDAHERASGAASNRPRIKLVHLSDLVERSRRMPEPSVPD